MSTTEVNQGRAGRSIRARMGAALIAVVALTGLAACGQKGGNDSSPANNETQATTGGKAEGGGAPTTKARSTGSSTPRTTRRSTSTTERSTASSTPRSTTTQEPVVVNPDSQYKEFCQAFADAVNDPTFANGDLSDIAGLIASFKKIYAELADKAPPPIAADWQAINAKVQAVTPDNFLDMGNDQEFTAAAERITEWTKTNCGFDPDKKSSSSGGSGGSGGGRTGDN